MSAGLQATFSSTSTPSMYLLPNDAAFRLLLLELASQGQQTNPQFGYDRAALLADPRLPGILLYHVIPGAGQITRRMELFDGQRFFSLNNRMVTVLRTVGITPKLLDEQSPPRVAGFAAFDRPVGDSLYHVITRTPHPHPHPFPQAPAPCRRCSGPTPPPLPDDPPLDAPTVYSYMEDPANSLTLLKLLLDKCTPLFASLFKDPSLPFTFFGPLDAVSVRSSSNGGATS
ncbi:hypothetical protein V8C86DRAFT_3102940 [Haematococcus lacustris]